MKLTKRIKMRRVTDRQRCVRSLIKQFRKYPAARHDDIMDPLSYYRSRPDLYTIKAMTNK